MEEYVWYDPISDELFINYLSEDLVIFGESLKPCICIGEL
jgi:hypothetical protein